MPSQFASIRARSGESAQLSAKSADLFRVPLLDFVTPAAIVVSIVAPLWQIIHLLRVRTADGLSIPSLAAATGSVALWFGYGVTSGDFPLALTYGICTTAALATLVMACRYSRISVLPFLGFLVSFFSVLGVAAVLIGPIAVATMTALVTFVRPGLQLRASLTSKLHRGISSGSFALIICAEVLWAYYGIAKADMVTASTSVWCGICFSGVVLRTMYLRRREARIVVPDDLSAIRENELLVAS